MKFAYLFFPLNFNLETFSLRTHYSVSLNIIINDNHKINSFSIFHSCTTHHRYYLISSSSKYTTTKFNKIQQFESLGGRGGAQLIYWPSLAIKPKYGGPKSYSWKVGRAKNSGAKWDGIKSSGYKIRQDIKS